MKIKSLALFFSATLVLAGMPLMAAEPATDAPTVSRVELEPYPEQPEGPGEGGGGVVMPTNIMDVAQFIETANRDLSRCANRPLSPQQCKARLDHAFSLNLLTQRAYDWALQNGYFPVVDTFGDYPEIGAVCKCGCFDPETLISARLNGVALDVAAGDITKQHQLLALQSDATRQNITSGLSWHQYHYQRTGRSTVIPLCVKQWQTTGGNAASWHGIKRWSGGRGKRCCCD